MLNLASIAYLPPALRARQQQAPVMRRPMSARGRAAAEDSARGHRPERRLPPPGAPTARPRTRRLVRGQELGLRAAHLAASRAGDEELVTVVRREERARQRGPKAVDLMGKDGDARLRATTDHLFVSGAA